MSVVVCFGSYSQVEGVSRKVKGLTAKAKYNKKSASVVRVTAAFKLTKKAAGKVTYTRVAKGSSKYLNINKKTGKITVKKGAPKQVHVLKVKVTAAGDKNHFAVSKTVTVKVRVK